MPQTAKTPSQPQITPFWVGDLALSGGFFGKVPFKAGY